MGLDEWAMRFDEEVRDWTRLQSIEQQLVRAQVGRWDVDFEDSCAQVAALRAAGQWYSGPTDFMGVLWMGHDEVRNCRMLAWLMDPGGAHGLGDGVLRGVTAAAPLDVIGASDGDRVSVATEQVLGGTRADIVVRTAIGTLVIEAKINAGESDGQTAGYQELWGEGATFLFLTREGSAPSADDPERWGTLRWIDIAAMIDRALGDGNPNAPGRGVAEGFRNAIRNHLWPRSSSGSLHLVELDDRGEEFRRE